MSSFGPRGTTEGTSCNDSDDHDDDRGFSDASDTRRGGGFLSKLKAVIFRRRKDGGSAVSNMTPARNFAASFAAAEMLMDGDDTDRNNNEENLAGKLSLAGTCPATVDPGGRAAGDRGGDASPCPRSTFEYEGEVVSEATWSKVCNVDLPRLA